jgi:hypothetical protein
MDVAYNLGVFWSMLGLSAAADEDDAGDEHYGGG